jgi:hypothetical protein
MEQSLIVMETVYCDGISPGEPSGMVKSPRTMKMNGLRRSRSLRSLASLLALLSETTSRQWRRKMASRQLSKAIAQCKWMWL